MTDERCAARERGDDSKALAIDSARSQRLLLASIVDDDDALSNVLDEVGDCASCMRGIATFLAGALGARWVENYGVEACVEMLTKSIAKTLDEQ